MVTTGIWKITYTDYRNIDIDLAFASAPEISDELNNDAVASFTVPNTDAMRNFIAVNYPISVFYDSELQFKGVLKAGDIGAKKIKCYVYDAAVLELDEAEPITGVYDAIPADEIMVDVLAGLTVTLGACPTTAVTVVLYKANRLDVVKFLADALGLDYYPTTDGAINIGFRNTATWSLPAADLTISKRAIDRTKYAGKVIMRGIDLFGHHVTGEAGTGSPVRTFNYDTPANQDALENLAARKLSEMQTDSAGAPISTRIDVGHSFQTGDYVNLNSSRYMISGNRRIVQMTKTASKVTMQLDYVRKSIDKTIADLRSWEKKGIYLPGCTSWSINLQGLIGHYHLNEGTSTVARDTSPRDDKHDGIIVGCSWEDYANMKILTFGGSAYVDIGSTIIFSDTNKFSIGGWFSPSELNGTTRYLVHKDGQFTLEYINNVLRATVTASDSTLHTLDSDAEKVKVGGRLFVMVTYDGRYLDMYINAQLHKTLDVNHNLAVSTNKVYLGMFLQGVLAEMMLWNRCLSDQEVTELYFFPLNRIG